MWINPTTGAVFKTHSDIRKSLPNTSLPADLTNDLIESFGFVSVAEGVSPTYNADTQEVVESAPIEIGGIWTKQYAIVALDAAKLEKVADAKAVTTTKADPVITYLVTHTPQECAAYVAANVTNLATASSLLQKFAMALSVLAKKEFR